MLGKENINVGDNDDADKGLVSEALEIKVDIENKIENKDVTSNEFQQDKNN